MQIILKNFFFVFKKKFNDVCNVVDSGKKFFSLIYFLSEKNFLVSDQSQLKISNQFILNEECKIHGRIITRSLF